MCGLTLRPAFDDANRIGHIARGVSDEWH